MRTDDKRKETSRLNALKSTGPKTPEGKRRSAFNSVTHGAYARILILPGEELTEFEELIRVHLETWKPINMIEDILVTEMATTLWRLRRQAPAETSLIDIQIQRMTCNEVEFTSLNAHGAYAIAVASLQSQSDALSQIARQGRRLLHQYQQLRQEILTTRQLFPPVAPDPPNLQSQPDMDSQKEPVESNLTEIQQTTTQSTESDTVKTQPAETKTIEAKLIGSITHRLQFPRETRVLNPHSNLYAALAPIARPAQPAPTTEIEAPTKVQSAGCV